MWTGLVIIMYLLSKTFLLTCYHKCVVFKVLFPSGSKVVIRRNSWGLDVIIETPRANYINNEKGLCLYSGPNVKAQVDTYGYNLT